MLSPQEGTVPHRQSGFLFSPRPHKVSLQVLGQAGSRERIYHTELSMELRNEVLDLLALHGRQKHKKFWC
ncbi:hypothetical protein Y1Q_0017009 [Alligator mississippiensis]|uniref:Uncharacterized protein n=1 Tax=Alligator mississippiensis TaxID=8496 RepID=A0A151MLI5_ALLMI|nr:hypothetical protein Y1Q_0017009 [Alligator mississippiensis]